jgi:hypothetical protein
MRWEALPINTTFDRARHREVYRRIAGLVRGEGERTLLPLDDVARRVRIFEQSYVGIQPIPVAMIVGTAGRSEDFDKDFLPRRPEARDRWMRVERSFSESEFPPIIVYQLGESYFVVDGHHRVAIAKQRKVEYIDAEITRFRARYELPADADVGRLILAEQHHLFMEESGLERARPEASIRFNRPDRYIELLELVKVHGFDLIQEHGRVLPREEIAADWYDNIYLPGVDAIHREALAEAFPNETVADIFLSIYERRRTLFPERGSLEFEDVVSETKRETDRK